MGNDFDNFLIARYKESEQNANRIKTITVSDLNTSWVQNLYLSMIKCGKYDTIGLSEEFKLLYKKSDGELQILLNNYNGD